MAIGLPFHDQSWSAPDALPEATPTADGRPDFGPGAPAESSLDLELVRAVIEDGLLMVFGPDGDPIPPEIFRAAAAEQPDAGVQLRDGPQVAAERIAAVFDAQNNHTYAFYSIASDNVGNRQATPAGAQATTRTDVKPPRV